MAMEGYIRGRPDANWFLEQIHLGKEFRKKAAFEDKWPIWREYYRGQWRDGIMPRNVFFSMLRSQVPRVYFRNPTVSVSPAKPGLENMAFARILERVDNKLLRQMNFKRHMKRGVQQAFMFGTAIPKVGFGGFYSPDVIEGQGEIPRGPGDQGVEYFSDAQPNMPWINMVRPGMFVVPDGLQEFDKSRWCAEQILRPIEDVRNDPRLENTKGIRTHEFQDTPAGTIRRRQHMARLWEVHDAKTGKVFIIAPDKQGSNAEDKILLFADDMFQAYGGFPYHPFSYNEDEEWFWGTPDSQILEPYQREINETRTQIMKHRRLTLIKLLVKRTSMDEADAEKLVNEDVQAVAWIKGQGSIKDAVQVMQQSTIPVELFRAAEETEKDIRETVGFSRNAAGEFNSRSGDTTATEATFVNQATEIRVDERRDITADATVGIIEHVHGVIFDNWGVEQIVDVVGPGGAPVWVKFRGDLLKNGRYNVKVDPDSTIPDTRALREQRAAQLYQLLETNPLIDPVQLTQYLLHELRGTQFDEMMKQLPVPQDGVPAGPVTPAAFGNLIQKSVATAANNNQRQRGAA